jgi:hypothetical protein
MMGNKKTVATVKSQFTVMVEDLKGIIKLETVKKVKAEAEVVRSSAEIEEAESFSTKLNEWLGKKP